MDQKLLRNLIEDAKRVYPNSELLQKVVVTQAIHESGFSSKRGGSQLALRYNNLFGIKGKGSKGSVSLPTWEVIGGKTLHVNADFAHYEDHQEAFEWHKRLMYRTRYARVLNAPDLDTAFKMLQVCGYATDPKYPGKLESTYQAHVKKEFDKA